MPFKIQHTHLKGILLCATGFACFSMCDVLRKYLAQDFSVLEILFWVACFSLIFTIISAPWMGGFKQTFKTKKAKWHLIRSPLFVLNSAFAVYAFSKLPMTDVYTLLFLIPFVKTILAALIWKEPLTRIRMLTIAVGFIGVLIALRPGFTEFNLGVLAALACTFTFSFQNLLMKQIGDKETPLSTVLYPVITIFLVSGGLLLALHENLLLIPRDLALFLFILTGFFYVLGWYVMSRAFVSTPATLLAPYQYTQFIWGLILGYLVFADTPDLWMISGAAIIAFSGLYLLWREGKCQD